MPRSRSRFGGAPKNPKTTVAARAQWPSRKFRVRADRVEIDEGGRVVYRARGKLLPLAAVVQMLVGQELSPEGEAYRARMEKINGQNRALERLLRQRIRSVGIVWRRLLAAEVDMWRAKLRAEEFVSRLRPRHKIKYRAYQREGVMQIERVLMALEPGRWHYGTKLHQELRAGDGLKIDVTRLSLEKLERAGLVEIALVPANAENTLRGPIRNNLTGETRMLRVYRLTPAGEVRQRELSLLM